MWMPLFFTTLFLHPSLIVMSGHSPVIVFYLYWNTNRGVGCGDCMHWQLNSHIFIDNGCFILIALHNGIA
jgi:hypothetical protein